MKSKDLAERIKKFVLDIIRLLRKLPKTTENLIIIKQIIRSGSSIGANYAEAIYSHSRQDFLHVMNICRKETNETIYWLDLLMEINPFFRVEFLRLLDEGTQILRIFVSSVKTAKKNKNEK